MNNATDLVSINSASGEARDRPSGCKNSSDYLGVSINSASGEARDLETRVLELEALVAGFH